MTSTVLPPQLTICSFVNSQKLARYLRQILSSDVAEATATPRYNLTNLSSTKELYDFVEEHKHQLDCLILQEDWQLLPVVNQLYERGTLLPAVIVWEKPAQTDNSDAIFYHPGEIRLPVSQLQEISPLIDQAIAEFLKLAPVCHLPDHTASIEPKTPLTDNQDFLMRQQRRLAEKLKERLGYLAVFYKRNPQQFFRHLSPNEKQQLLEKLRLEYSQIVLNYFSEDYTVNEQIDNLVNLVFFADISVSKVMEIHMELMDEFAHKLKLEGRSEEILLDYRLTLIDVLAHLGEMYRRSLPREL